MLIAGEVHVWRVRLDRAAVLAPTAGEAERAARFAAPEPRRRYLRAHAALRAAPPLPTISTLELAILSRRESGPVTPAASVLVPRHLPALRQTVFTAPMRRASGSTASR